MPFIAYSCSPTSNIFTGELILNEREESLSSIFNCAYVLGSTVLYPALFIFDLLAELFLALDLCRHQYKNWSIGRRIKHLETCPDSEIHSLKERRIQKLSQRINLSDRSLTVKKLKEIIPPEASLSDDDDAWFDKVIETYKITETNVKNNDYDLPSIFAKTKLEKLILALITSMNLSLEIEAYQKTSSPEELRKIFKDRYEFSQIRHQLSAHIDKHYIHVLAKTQIPVIGLLFTAHDRYTTKQSLEATDLPNEYNQRIKQYDWLKPYGR